MSTESPSRLQNRLANETSPYLLQHASNPVAWQAWGESALEEARRENKPIFLSIGYSACHWCHVMERETFSNPQIAEILNANFVCIKVDREERPDLDDLYMAATVAMNGQGGWPMNVFLAPDLKPFFAGTYFPPEDNQGRPGFASLVGQLSQVWKENREDLLEQAERLTARLKRQFQGQGPVLGLEPEILDQAVSELAQRFDGQNGGFGGAPKFPAPANLQMLLRYHARSQDPRVLEMATRTLDAMANGGIFDHLGGGFARYSVDERWVVPHFEKMLYDNAQLAWVYLEGYSATQQPLYRKAARQTLDFILREMTTSEGGFGSALDADSEGEEGKFYCWTPAQLQEVLGDSAAQRFAAYYGVTSTGNFEGKSVLNISRSLNQVAAQLGLDAEEYEKELESSRSKLLEARQGRVRPAFDDKVITGWNGMTIQALAEGYRVLGDLRYLEAAQKAAAFLKEKLTFGEGRLHRTYRAGKAHLNGFLEDYAFLGEGLLSLYEACGDKSYFDWASQLMDTIEAQFAREEGGFFETSADHEPLLLRHRSFNDGAVPSAQAVAALLSLRLSYHLEQSPRRERALEVLTSIGRELRQLPSAHCRYLMALDFALAGPLQMSWCLPSFEVSQRPDLMNAMGRHFVPNRTVAWLCQGKESVALPALQGKSLGEAVQLHLCQSSTCAAPVKSPEELVAALATLRQAVRFELHPRVPGGASVEGTTQLAQAHPQRYRALGSTGLQVSRLGFGGYRVDDENPEHRAALEQAWESGINLFDTSANYTDGGSERLYGYLLRRQAEQRSQMVVVSKAGYVQGTNLDVARAREQLGRPYPELVPYQEGCWHCIHPEFLADQLERSLMRLSLQKLDIFLLHNPEYFLLDAQQKGASDRAGVHQEYERRIKQAFTFLEQLVQEGKIGFYGISSNTFAGPSDALTTTNLGRVLELAKEVGGDEHHFRVVQVPLNLLEGEAAKKFLAEAESAGLGVLLNRPLNAFVQQTLVRLVDFEIDSEHLDVSASLEVMSEIENEYRANFGPFVQGPGADQLFRFAENLAPLENHLQNLEHWMQLESQRIRPALMEQVQALDQAMQGPIAEPWFKWRERYMAAFRDVSNDLEEVAIRKSARLSASVKELMQLPEGPAQGGTLSQQACWVADGLSGVSSVLVGMRSPDYVEDLTPMLDWPRCPQSLEVLKKLESWSNPFGVLV